MKLLEPLKRKISLMLSRAIINLIDDSNEIQLAQISLLAGETRDDAEVFGNYGFASNPPSKSEAIVGSIGGARSHSVILAIANREFRLKLLETGEVAIHDDQGQKVHLKRDGIEITTPQKLTINAPNCDWNGDINHNGIIHTNDVLAGNVSLKNHKHLLVKTGTDKSGVPE